MTIRIFSIAFIGLMSVSGFSQSVNEMVLFSRHQNIGTPRSMGTGGAFSALGNDFSSIHINPAGAGAFRRDQSEFSLGFFGNASTNRFEANSSQQSQGGVTIPNFGLSRIVSQDKNNMSVFAFTFTQNASFAENNTVQGVSHLPNGDIYDEVLTINTTGYSGEMGLTYGVNKGYKWYYGFGVGIPVTRYNETYVTDQELYDSDFSRVGVFVRDELYLANSIGINAKAGVIYRPIPNLRIGLSAQSPTANSYTGEIDVYMFGEGVYGNEDGSAFESTGFNPNLRYSLMTAARANTGLAYVFGKRGFFSIDYNYIDPRAGRYSSRNVDVDDINDDINNLLAPIHQIRTGVELRFNNFFVRGGYSYTTSGYDSDRGNTGTTGIHSGLGYQNKKFGLHMGLVNFQEQSNYFFSGVGEIPTPYTTSRNRTMFTIGVTLLQ